MTKAAAVAWSAVLLGALGFAAWRVTVDGGGMDLETSATIVPTTAVRLQATTLPDDGRVERPFDRNRWGLDGADGLSGLVEGAANRNTFRIRAEAEPEASTTTAGPTTTAPTTTTPTAESSIDTPTTGSPSTTAAPATTTPETTTPSEPTATTGPTNPGGPCFAPAFRDDFSGQTVSGDWLVYTTNGSHSPHAVRRAEAVAVVDGKLVITAENDEHGVLQSGGLRHRGAQTYGRYSFRVRTDADMTNATSGVILTWPTSGDQPTDGENNIYETLWAPGSRWPFYSFIHEPFDDRADGVSQARFVFEGDATQWQVMTMEWTPHHVEITRTGPGRQGRETHRLDEDGSDRISDAEHFLSIQFDLFKGSFPDDRQRRMEVDWIQIESYCGG